MEVRATYKYAKISPFKAREIAREIQGLPVSAALDVVAYSPKKAAALINKTLKSAVANAENNANLRVAGLVVKEATVGEGPTMKRMMPRARGSGSRILKRSSHIRIILTDEIEIKTRDKKKRQKKKSKGPEAKRTTEPKPKAEMNEEISKMAQGKQIKIDIQEIKTPELDAQLVAENVALQIERRIAYRRAMKKAVQVAMDFGAQGIRLRSSGRLNGAEISRSEWYREGKVQ